MSVNDSQNYSLTEWEQYRQQVAQNQQETMALYEQQVELANAAGEPAPPPPEPVEPPPAIPPAFDPAVFVEYDQIGDYQKAAQVVYEEYKDTFSWLKSLRTPKESMWGKCYEYYDMVQELAYDENRRKSVQMADKFKPNAEMSPERMALVLPFAYEAVQVVFAHLYSIVRGQGLGYVDIAGRTESDIPAAQRIESFLNYQYGYEIPTSDKYTDYILDSIIVGSGIMFQAWDAMRNTRKLEVIPRYNIWWDGAPTIQEAKVITIRREVSVGELYALRDAQGTPIWFDNDALERAAAATLTDQDPRTYANDRNPDMNHDKLFNATDAKVNPKYQKVYLDIMWHTEPKRWVYVVNEALVVGVTQPSVPDMPDDEIESRFPITVFSPIRKRGDIDGDSFVSRILDVQDMSNAALATMIEHMKSAALGVGFTTDEDLAGRPIKAGSWVYTDDPANARIDYPAANAQQFLGVIDWLTNRVADKVTGVTSELRGQAKFAGMSATAIRDLSSQGAARMSPMDDRALAAMQDQYSLAITMNRIYLAPHKLFQVVGTEGLPVTRGQQIPTGQEARPITAKDMIGAVGKDLVPTGFPGSQQSDTQTVLNEAAVVAQTGGNPTPLMREYFETKYRGILDVDEMYPQNAIGHDPLQENENILAGISVSRDPDDVDMHHIQIHQMLMVDQRFLMAIQQNPMLYAILEAHVSEHLQKAQEQAAIMAGAQQGTANGGVGTSGLGTNMVTAQPKTDAAREAQMGAM